MFTHSLKSKLVKFCTIGPGAFLFALGLGLFIFSNSVEAVEYNSLCGYITEASKNCDSQTGECAGQMKLTNVCQYSFYKLLVPYGTKYLKITFRNKNVYNRLSCREVKVVARLDNDYLDENLANVKRVVFYEDLKTQNTYLLKDLSEVYVMIQDVFEENDSPMGRGEKVKTNHILYIGVLSHVDEIVISFDISDKYISIAGCNGEMKAEVDEGCSGESECGAPYPYHEEELPFTDVRRFFWSRIKLECMPDNLSGCKEKSKCEDAGGYWIENKCLDAVPFTSYVYECNHACLDKREIPSFCAGENVYDVSDKLDVYLHLPKFDREVDVYLGMMKPNGELEIIYRRAGEIKRRVFKSLDDLIPFKEKISEEYSTSFSWNISLVSFSGEYVKIMDSGDYTLYLLILPSGESLSENNYILQSCSFSIR